jgi:hypothetical protein
MFKDDGTPFRDVEDNLWSLPRRLADADAAGVGVHVLSTVPVMFSYWARPEHTADLSQMLNDHVARCVATNPQRFIGASAGEGARGRPHPQGEPRRAEAAAAAGRRPDDPPSPAHGCPTLLPPLPPSPRRPRHAADAGPGPGGR